jgi:hypothetical protein
MKIMLQFSLNPIMGPGRYNLSWNYEERCASMVEAFLNIQKREDFSDVTLVTDDDQVVKAHRIILGACSSFFGNIFLKTNVRDLCLFLPGIAHGDLEAILNFVYNGQTDIPVESLESFTKAAKQLRIKGLADVDGMEDDSNDENIVNTQTAVNDEFQSSAGKGFKNKCKKCEFECARKDTLKNHMTKAHKKAAIQLDIEGLADVESVEDSANDESMLQNETQEYTDDSMLQNETQEYTIETSLEEQNEEENVNSVAIQLDFTQVKEEPDVDNGDLDNSESSEHMEDDDLNDKTAISEEMSQAIDSAGKGFKYKCEHCEFVCARKDRLKKHMAYAHTTADFLKCTKCDYVTIDNLELAQHKETKHKKVKAKKSTNVFPCNLCDYRARSLENLERHTKFIVHKPKIDA